MGCSYIFKLVFSFSSDKYPKGKLLNHTAVLFLIFQEPQNCFPEGVYQLTLPATVEFSSLHIITAFVIPFFFFLLKTIMCGDILLMFWFALTWWLVILCTFSCTCWPDVCLLQKKKMSIQVFCPFWNQTFFLCYWLVWVL